MSRARFANVMRRDPTELMLDEASLLIAAALDPELDEIEWLAALDVLAGECPTPTADGVARYLFDDLGYAGNQRAYYDWRNSCLDQVIATRTGIPISLSVLMIEVARRVGVPLVGIGMPAHFVVRAAADETRFYDPFHGSGRLDLAGVRSLFADVTHEQVAWDDGFVAPTSNRDIVVRMLNNLKATFVRQSDALRLAIVMGLRAEVPELLDAEGGEIRAATAVFN